MSAESLREQIAKEIHHEGWPFGDDWLLDPERCGTCSRCLRQADAVLAVLGEVTVTEEWGVSCLGDDGRRHSTQPATDEETGQ